LPARERRVKALIKATVFPVSESLQPVTLAL